MFFSSRGDERLNAEIDVFCESALFEQGRLAHFRFAALIDIFGEERFNAFLPTIGITQASFLAWKDYSCSRDSGAAARCIRDPGGYCDPTICRGW